MSGQPSVLQVVILRDGLLVGTEVFVPGTYSIGADPSSDLRLDDASVAPRHAQLYFQNGRAAIQDAGAGGVFVNGHPVTACEIRSVDEVMCGPFVLKTRVLQQRPPEAKPQPPPELAALLGGPAQQPAQPPPAAPPAPVVPPASVAPAQPAPPARQLRPAAPAQGLAATVAAAPNPLTPVATPASPVAPPVASPTDGPTTVLHNPPPATTQVFGSGAGPVVTPPSGTQVFGSGAVAQPQPQPHTVPAPVAAPAATPVPDATMPSVRRRPAEPPASAEVSNILFADELLADTPLDDARPAGPLLNEEVPDRPTHAPRVARGSGPAQLYLELYWGAVRREARRFAPGKKPVQAGTDERTDTVMPLWGFNLPTEGVPLAESVNGTWRLFVPPDTQVEKSGQDGRFVPATSSAIEADGSRRFITLREGTAVRLAHGAMSLVAYAAPVPERVRVSPLKNMPWAALGCFAFFGAMLAAFLIFKPRPAETADFTQKSLPPVALRLIAPEPKKKEEAKKKLEAIKAQSKQEKPVAKATEKPATKQVEKAPREQPKATAAAPESKALKALAKLSAAGPATNDLLAAVDKLGSGPGSKNAKTSNFKLSGLVGKAPIANAGVGTFGLGGGGKGGGATLGAELLRGKGGGGIGALGAGGVGKGKVGGTVTRATARSIAAQGSIDRDAVARVVNSHLHEVHSCYERALLRDPGLAGKVVLEWTVATNGQVSSARTKSSTLRNSAVESCILNALKKWTFPPARGGSVIITYPFLFNSVGY